MSAIFPFTKVGFFVFFFNITIDKKRKWEIEITDNFYSTSSIP